MSYAWDILLFVGKLAVTAMLLALVLRGVDVQGAQARVAGASPYALAVALAFGTLQIVLGAWRWIIVTEILCGVRMPIGRTSGVAAIGILAGQTLPSTVGGDAVRVGFIARSTGVGPATRSVIADRILGLLALGAIALFSTGYLALAGLYDAALLIPAGLAVTGLSGAAVLVAIAPLRSQLPGWMSALAAPASDLRRLLGERRALLAIGISILAHLLSVASFVVLAVAVSFHEISLATLALFVSPALLVSTIPISIGGWGIRESALSVGLAIAGVGSDGPVILSVLFGLTMIASGILLSPCWFLRQGRARDREIVG